MTIDLGRVTPIYRGEYDAAETYEINDIVLSGNELFWHVGENPTTGIAPGDPVWALAFSGADVLAAIEQIEEDAEAIALGTRNGVPVSSGDPFYQNNAKYYADQANGSASAASGSANAAAGSASKAAQWATGGTTGTPSSTNNAKHYSEQAAASAAAASASASDAEAYAAGTRGGEPVSSSDPAYENNAKYYADAAEEAAATLTVDDEMSGSSTNPVQNKVIAAALDKKLDLDGYSALATVGNAEQLVSTVRVIDKAPYIFRKSGGSADIGNREYDTVVGGTNAWNQLLTDGSFSVSDGTITESGGVGTFTPTAANAQAYKVFASIGNHVYLVSVSFKTASATTAVQMRAFGINTAGVESTSYQTINKLHKTTNAGTSAVGIIDTRASDWDATEIRNFMCIDLTALFGSAAIADYVYSLEQANAGSGIAWLKLYGFFTKPYYSYNVGALASVAATAHETVGFNQWDEEWEVGGYDTQTGDKIESSSQIRSKNAIPIFGGATYFARTGQTAYVSQLLFYDVSGNYLGKISPNHNNYEFVSFNNASYLRFQAQVAYGTTYNHDIGINLSGYRNGEYEPYRLNSYPLDSSLILRGITKLDADGNLYYDGDSYEADGTVTRRYGIVDLGTLTWGISTNNRFIATLTGIKSSPDNNTLPNAIMSDGSYIQSTGNGYNAAGDKSYYVSTAEQIVIKNTAYSTSSDFTTAISGVYLVYELATPITETADPFQTPQAVDDFGTERYIVTAQGGVEMPVGHITEYPANLRDKLQHLPDLAETDGIYVIVQIGARMVLVPLITPTELPAAPGGDGTYTLKCTVSGGAAAYSWEADA